MDREDLDGLAVRRALHLLHGREDRLPVAARLEDERTAPPHVGRLVGEDAHAADEQRRGTVEVRVDLFERLPAVDPEGRAEIGGQAHGGTAELSLREPRQGLHPRADGIPRLVAARLLGAHRERCGAVEEEPRGGIGVLAPRVGEGGDPRLEEASDLGLEPLEGRGPDGAALGAAVLARLLGWALRHAKNLPDRLAAVARQLGSRSRYRSALAEGTKIPAETLQFLVDSAPDGVAILVRGVVVFINPRGAQLLGAASPEAVLGTPIARYMPPEDARLTAERIGAMFRTGVEQPPNEYSVVADPSRTVEIKSIVCRWEGQPAVLAFARDVSDRKAIQQKLVEADRLTALGTLAAGVAHEINNPLTYVELGLQRIEHATRGHAVAAEVRELLGNVEHGVARIAAITRSLRTFARSDDAPPSPVDVRAVLERALQMLDNQLRHEAIVSCDLADAPPVLGNASKLEQVFVNLLNNARHALAGEPRRIDVGLVTEGDTVVVTVRDTGTGIPAAIRHRVFEPFFTTRAVGDGMGLGLPVCKSIVESLGGTIEIDSTEGAGTTARVTLRAHRDAGGDDASPTPDAPPPRSAARRRVLLVDDDALVRHAVARALEPHHDVTAVDGGAAALAALATSRFDVILCDVMMPGMSGRELFARIAALHPGLERRLVFITGGTFTAELDAFLVGSGNRRLTKPFPMAELLEAIERLTGP